MIAQKIYVEQTNTNTQVIQYSINIKAVPFNGEEEGNEQPNKRRKKQHTN